MKKKWTPTEDGSFNQKTASLKRFCTLSCRQKHINSLCSSRWSNKFTKDFSVSKWLILMATHLERYHKPETKNHGFLNVYTTYERDSMLKYGNWQRNTFCVIKPTTIWSFITGLRVKSCYFTHSVKTIRRSPSYSGNTRIVRSEGYHFI